MPERNHRSQRCRVFVGAGLLILTVLLTPWKGEAGCNAPGGQIVNVSIAESSVGYHVCVDKSTTITVTMDHPYAGTFNWDKSTGSDKITLANANQATVTVNGGHEPSASKDDQTLTAKFTPDNPTGWILDDCYAEAKLTVCRMDPITIDESHKNFAVPPGGTCFLTAHMNPTGRDLNWRFSTLSGKGELLFTNTISGTHHEKCEFTPSVNSPEGYVMVEVYDSAWTECLASARLLIGCECGDSTCTSPGAGKCKLECVEVRLRLGSGEEGFTAGDLWLMTNAPSASLATPAALQLMNRSAGTEAILASNILRQVLAPECLADIVTNSPFKYTVSFFKRDDVEAAKGSNGFYVVKTGRDSFAEYRFENPAATTNDVNTLLVVRTTGPVSGRTVVTNQYVWTGSGSTSSWALTSGNGLRTEEKSSVSNGTVRAETRAIKNSSELVVAKTVSTFERYSWGEVLTGTVNDPDGAALRTSYRYFTATNPAGKWGKLQMEVQPEGGWTRYDYDSQGRMILQVSGWKDSPTNSAENEAQAVYMGYTPVDPNDNDTGAIYVASPRVETNTVLGQVVGITWRAYYLNGANEQVEIVERAASASSGYGDPGNERNTAIIYPAGTNVAGAGRAKTSIFPDGRQDSWTYESGIYTTNSNPASNSFTPGTGNCVRATVAHGTTNSPAGIAGKSTRDVTIEDPLGRTIMRETWVYTGSGYERVAWAVNTLDDFGRVAKTCRSDGTVSESTWGCCGKEWELDAGGIERDFSFDALDRQDITTKEAGTNDITTSSVLDAAGRTLKTTESSGGLALTTSNLFDNANRKIAEWSEAGLMTSYSYSNGGRIVTVVSPGSATNTTENYLDGRTKNITGNAQTSEYFDYGVNADGSQWTIVYNGPAGSNSPMWVRTTTDLLGRTIRTERPAFLSVSSVISVVTNSSFFNSKGQLVRSTQPGQADTLYEYNELGEQIRSGLDVNGNGTLDLSGPDRVSESSSSYQSYSSLWWQVSASSIYAAYGSSVATTTSMQRVQLTGLGVAVAGGSLASATVSQDLLGNQTVSQTAIDRATKTVTQITDVPDSTNDAVSITVNGVLVSSSSPSVPSVVTYSSDALERQIGVTDPRTGTSTTHYNDKGQVDWVENSASNRTTFAFDESTGREVSRTDAVTGTVFTAYDVRGQVIGTWGTTYPEFSDFNSYGQKTAMYTLRTNLTLASFADFSSNISVFDKTTWLYDEATGLLTNKLYADNKGPNYTYTPDGKLLTRTWARSMTNGQPLVTTYAYTNTTGEMIGINYSDNTPAIGFSFNRLGQYVTVADSKGTRSFTYNDALLLAAETNAFAVITRTYDSQGRSAGLALHSLGDGGFASCSIQYGYSGDGRFSSLSSLVGGQSNSWNYSYLANSDLLAGWNETASGAGVSRQYEPNRNLITGVSNGVGGSLVSVFNYQNDALGRRTQRTDNSATTNLFGYDSLSQLTNALMNGDSFGWVFDPIGNRVTDTTNGVTEVYVANSLNQCTQITNGGTRNLFYDLDGNLTNDSVFAYTFNGENRLIKAEPLDLTAGAKRVRSAYDYMGRRWMKAVDTWDGSVWIVASTNLFEYDGFNLVQEQNETGGVIRSYVRGLDLSGSLQGAGGIGGLLAMQTGTNSYFYFGDANGNITELTDASGAVAVHYEWDAYGNRLNAPGANETENPYGYSSQYFDKETGQWMYIFRPYIPPLGRWCSRDPSEEAECLDLYVFVINSPCSLVDTDGRQIVGPGAPRGGWNSPSLGTGKPLGGSANVSSDSAEGGNYSFTFEDLKKQFTLKSGVVEYSLPLKKIPSFPVGLATVEQSISAELKLQQCCRANCTIGSQFKGAFAYVVTIGFGKIAEIIKPAKEREGRNVLESLKNKIKAQGGLLGTKVGATSILPSCADAAELSLEFGVRGRGAALVASASLTGSVGGFALLFPDPQKKSGGHWSFDKSKVETTLGISGVGARIEVFGKGEGSVTIVVD